MYNNNIFWKNNLRWFLTFKGKLVEKSIICFYQTESQKFFNTFWKPWFSNLSGLSTILYYLKSKAPLLHKSKTLIRVSPIMWKRNIIYIIIF